MLHTSFKGRRERQKGRMYDSQLKEDGREEVEAREDLYGGGDGEIDGQKMCQRVILPTWY